MAASNKTSALLQTLFWGLFSAILYFALYYFEAPILNWSKAGTLAFIVPVFIAFLFSFVHGAFTTYFWDLLGVKAKSIKK